MGLTLAVAAGVCWLADPAHRCPHAAAGWLGQRLFGCARAPAEHSADGLGQPMPEPGPEPRIIDLEPAPLSRALELIDLDQLSQPRPEGVEPPVEEECEPPSATTAVYPLTPAPAQEEELHTGVGIGLGLGGSEYPKVMPPCVDEEIIYPATMPYADEDEDECGSLLDFWMGLLSGPVLEAGEAAESEEPPTCPEQATCPFACPACPARAVRSPTDVLHSRESQQEIENEECPRHPEVDTMEARKGEFEYFRPNRPN
jgi:hypothetical protein